MGRASIKDKYSPREIEEDYKFSCILYAESDSYDIEFCFNCLKNYFYHWAYIYHDCDRIVQDDIDKYCYNNKCDVAPFELGDLKKPHYHIIGILKSSKSKITLYNATKHFGLPCEFDGLNLSHFVERVSDVRGLIRYFTHIDYPEKYQYDRSLICSNFSLLKFFNDDFDSQLALLFDFIEDNYCTSSRQLTRFALSHNFGTTLRLAFPILKSCMYELQSELIESDYHEKVYPLERSVDL